MTATNESLWNLALRLLVACVFLSSCTSSSVPTAESAITAADAKSALVELLNKTDDADLHRFVDHLKEAEAEYAKEGNAVSFGPWTCDLSSKRFAFVIASPPEIYLEYSGVFLCQSDGKWGAKVEVNRQT